MGSLIEVAQEGEQDGSLSRVDFKDPSRAEQTTPFQGSAQRPLVYSETSI